MNDSGSEIDPKNSGSHEETLENIVFLTEQATFAHERIINEFGGLQGIRDQGALHSAIAAPFASFGGEQLHNTIFDQAASLMRSLSQNHPFLDGNKRISLFMTELFLTENGFVFKEDVGIDEIFDMTISIAKGEKNVDDISKWLTDICKPAIES